MRSGRGPLVGWCVDDTAGAASRLRAVLPYLTSRCTLIASLDVAGDLDLADVDLLRLPWPPAEGTPPPVIGPGEVGLDRDGAARLASWIALDEPDLVVVDGPPHVALFARQCGVPVVTVVRHGREPSPGQRILDEAMTGFLAPYPPVLEPGSTPDAVRRRTVHAGMLSRFGGRRPNLRRGRQQLGLDPDAAVVTVVCGEDGLRLCGAHLAAAAAATPTWTWVVVGRASRTAETPEPVNLRRLGWQGDPWPALEAADVVVAGASLSIVAEVASARRPLLVVPREGRADDEEHARLLAESGAAAMLPRDLEPDAWPAVLTAARAEGGRQLARLDDGRGPERAADWVDAWALSPPDRTPEAEAVLPRVVPPVEVFEGVAAAARDGRREDVDEDPALEDA